MGEKGSWGSLTITVLRQLNGSWTPLLCYFATDVHVNDEVRFVATRWICVNCLTQVVTIQVVSQLHELFARGVVPDGGEVGPARARASCQASSINRRGETGRWGAAYLTVGGIDVESALATCIDGATRAQSLEVVSGHHGWPS